MRMPYHLILENGTMEKLESIKEKTNPKLRTNHMINRCIKLVHYIVTYADANDYFSLDLSTALGTDDFKKFFFHGGV